MTIRSRVRRIHLKRDYFYSLLALAALLIGVRLALPYIVKDYVNRRLASLDAYVGHVDDVDMGLWRGAYRVDGMKIQKKGEKQPTPFFDSRRVDFSVEWRSLFHGSLVSEAHFYEPKLNLVEGPTENQSQLGSGEDWHERLEELFPFHFNTVEVHDGTITFRTPGIATQDALTAQHVHAIVTNITNVVDKKKPTFADFRMTAKVLGGADTYAYGSAQPFNRNSTFDLNFAVEHVKVPQINPWLREYLKADAKRGDFDLYLEVAAANGRYEGYAKPLLRNVQFLSLSDEPVEHPVKGLWNAALQLATKIFENQPHQQVAARVPFHGTIEGTTRTDLLASIGSVLRNAFVGAFARSIEDRISMKNVQDGDTKDQG